MQGLPSRPGRLRLFDFDLARGGSRLGHLLLRDVDAHHSVLHLGRDLVTLDIVGKQQALLELRVGKFAAQVGALVLLVLLLLLGIPGAATSILYSSSFSRMLTAGAVALRRSMSQSLFRKSLKMLGSQF